MALKRKRSSDGTLVDDFHYSTPPTSSTNVAENHQTVCAGEEYGMPVRKRRRTDSFRKLLSLKVLKWSGCLGPEDDITSAFGERDETKQACFLTGRKRKRSSHCTQVCDSHESTPPTSSTNAADIYQIISAGEEDELPVRKRRRTDVSEKLLSLEINETSSNSSQDQGVQDVWSTSASIYERSAEEDHGLQDSLSSDLEVLPVVFQSPPAPVHHSLVSPAPASKNNVDWATEDDILSRYEIGRMLGKGGFGCVYEGKRLEDGLEVAVKIARKPKNMKYISIPGHPAALPLEVGLLILVNAEPKVPEIIELLDWQDQPDRYIMVLERPSPCQDLFDFMLYQAGFVEEDIARKIMAQAAMAAHMCCCRGVFHRDIKLENLLFNTQTHEVKLIDFGCGDLLQESGYENFCGTPEYCPPEYNVTHKYHGKPSTVWSLGILLFRLVCGRFPESKDIQMIDYGIWFDPDLSSECCFLIRALLNENPSERMDLKDILLHEWFTVTK